MKSNKKQYCNGALRPKRSRRKLKILYLTAAGILLPIAYICIFSSSSPTTVASILNGVDVDTGKSRYMAPFLFETMWTCDQFSRLGRLFALLESFLRVSDRQARNCQEKLSATVQPVLCEIGQNFHLTQHDSLVKSDTKSSSCEPLKKRYSCSMLKYSSLPCEKDFIVEEFNYHTQQHCIMQLVEDLYSRRKTRVPRLLHYVWYYESYEPFLFHNYLGLLSHLRFFKPSVVFLWNDGKLPTSEWWQELISSFNQPQHLAEMVIPEFKSSMNRAREELDDLWKLRVSNQSNSNSTRRVPLFGSTKFFSIYRQQPQSIYRNPIRLAQHRSDIVRLEALLLYGGLYVDSDMVAVRNVDPLLDYSITMGLEADEGQPTLANSVIFAERNTSHLYAWHQTYSTFEATEWGEHSTQGNYKLASECPANVHTELDSLVSPSRANLTLLYGTNVSLANNYMLHLWWRYRQRPNLREPNEILWCHSTVCRVFRALYFGTCDEFCG